MARSVWCGSLFLVASALVACGGGSDTKSSSGAGGDTSTGSGTTSSSGSTTATSSSSTTTTSTTTTGAGGSGTGGSGVGGAGVGGAGGAGTASGGGGAGGAGTTSSSVTTGPNPSDLDQDGDGWTPNEGDCCDVPGQCSDKPQLVNPGAYEYLGNAVDDDCDPNTVDIPPGNMPVDCTGGALQTPTTSDELLKAMDICKDTVENPPKPQKTWGIISSAILTADGGNAQTPKDVQTGVLAGYGSGVLPQQGATLAAISSGTARDEGDAGFYHPQNGPNVNQKGNYNANTQTGAPADWLAAHGGNIPQGCGGQCVGNNCTVAYDSVNLKARIRVPTNAKGFSYRFKFYTAEYAEYLCQQYNDFFLTLVDSQAPAIPADKNIAFDSQNNLVSVNSAFLEVCVSQNGVTCTNQAELVGTGMGGWNGALTDGGGTKWLTNEGAVVPGETMEIRFVVWDAADHNVDSLVLLDKFNWKIDAATVGVHK